MVRVGAAISVISRTDSTINRATRAILRFVALAENRNLVTRSGLAIFRDRTQVGARLTVVGSY